jgi:hypothetical protein
MSDEDRAELKRKLRPFMIIIGRLFSLITLIMLIRIIANDW